MSQWFGVPSEDEEKHPSNIQEKEHKACPKCASPMELVSSSRRPSWSELFYGSDHPSWFGYFNSGRSIGARRFEQKQKTRLIRAERDGPVGDSIRQRLAGVINQQERHEGPPVESQKVHFEVVAK